MYPILVKKKLSLRSVFKKKIRYQRTAGGFLQLVVPEKT